MTKVFDDMSLKPTRKLIMLAIADNANDTGVAFPSWNTLVKKTGLSRQGLQDNLKALETDGYLFKKNRSRKKGGRSSNKYVIYPHQNKDILDEEDYLLFEDLYIQSQSDVLSSQSQSDVLGADSQSQSDVLESEPSLISSKPSLKKNTKKDLDLAKEVAKDLDHKYFTDLKEMKYPLNEESYQEWIQERKEKKKPLTQMAMKKQIKLLCRYPQDIQAQIIDTSINANYQGLFEPKQNYQSKSKNTTKDTIRKAFEKIEEQKETEIIDYE